MKIKLLVTLITLAFAIMAPSFVMADLGVPDTCFVLTTRPDIAGDHSSLVAEVWVFNDTDELTGVNVSFLWENDELILDSVKTEPAASVFNSFIFTDGVYNLPLANENNRASFAGWHSMGMTTLQPSGSRKHLASYYFTLSSWTAESHLVLDSTHWDDGSELLFSGKVSGGYVPVWYWGERGIHVQDPSDAGGDDNSLPYEFSLSQNYPNPFNPSTTIEFTLEKSGNYTLTVFNVIGQVVEEWSDYGSAGDLHSVSFGDGKASGVYFYKLTAGDFTDTKKMMLVK